MSVSANKSATRLPHVAVVVAHPGRWGGMETFSRFLVRSALQHGSRVTVALSGDNIYADLERDANHGLTVESVHWLDGQLAGDRRYGWRTVLHRYRWFRRHRPDVAVFVQSSNTPMRASVLGAALAGVPVVTTHRTMAWPLPDVPRSRHLFGLLPGLGLHNRLMRRRTWLTARLARKVVFNSHAVRAGYETLYGYPSDHCRVIPNAVDAAYTDSEILASCATSDPASRGLQFAGSSDPANCGYQPTRLTDPASRGLQPARSSEPGAAVDPPSTPLIAGFVGRFGPEKCLDLLLRAVAALPADLPVRVGLWGEGPDEPRLRQLADQLGLAARIDWHGPTARPASAYAACDMVVCCSRREASSNMVLEAMAAGKPVIVTAVGGLPELIGHGACGRIVPPHDVPALAGAIQELAAETELRRKLGEHGQQQALTHHHPLRIAEAWYTLLCDAAGLQADTEPAARNSIVKKADTFAAPATLALGGGGT